MKDTTKRRLHVALCMLGAFVAGAAAMNLFYMHRRPVYRDVMKVSYRVEQTFRASRANRSHDSYRALAHRWNAVDAHERGEIGVFEHGVLKNEDSEFWFPFVVYVLGKIGEGPPRGQAIVKGIDCGKLALALESVGASKEAETYWEIARSLTGHKTVKDTKESVSRLMKNEDMDIHKKAEEALLDK